MRDRFHATLVRADGSENYVSCPASDKPPVEIEFVGKIFILTRQRTSGGWLVYKERFDAKL